MNWEMIGWLALATSGLVIVASFFVARTKSSTTSTSSEGITDAHPLHAWLEIAWPVFFIAIMGMLTLKEVLGFPAVLLLATVLTGIVWAVDTFVRKKSRANKSA